MLKEYEHKLHMQIRQLSCDAHNCDGSTNQDKQFCEALYVLCKLYEDTHSDAVNAKYIKFCGENK